MLESFGTTAVVAPHPDDETLGCGATLLRLGAETDHPMHWVLMTRMTADSGFSPEDITRRDAEIERVAGTYGFKTREQLPFGAASLDAVPTSDLVAALAAVFDELQPETLLLPFPSDAHSDHRRTFSISIACSKWFRRPYIRRILCYEVLSETGWNLDPTAPAFNPNFFVPVDPGLIEKKIQIMDEYALEMAAFPFPRSDHAIRSLASLRGSQCGTPAAEGFVVIREVA